MKTQIIANIILYMLASCSAAVYRGHYNDTNYPGKCVMKQFNLVLSPGDIVQHPNYCGRLLCFEEGLIIGHTCGIIAPPPECILGEYSSPEAPYPDCCFREFECNNIDYS